MIQNALFCRLFRSTTRVIVFSGAALSWGCAGLSVEDRAAFSAIRSVTIAVAFDNSGITVARQIATPVATPDVPYSPSPLANALAYLLLQLSQPEIPPGMITEQEQQYIAKSSAFNDVLGGTRKLQQMTETIQRRFAELSGLEVPGNSFRWQSAQPSLSDELEKNQTSAYARLQISTWATQEIRAFNVEAQAAIYVTDATSASLPSARSKLTYQSTPKSGVKDWTRNNGTELKEEWEAAARSLAEMLYFLLQEQTSPPTPTKKIVAGAFTPLDITRRVSGQIVRQDESRVVIKSEQGDYYSLSKLNPEPMLDDLGE